MAGELLVFTTVPILQGFGKYLDWLKIETDPDRQKKT